jgi:cysteine synthase A
MNIARDITALVGHTPLVRLNRVVDSAANTVVAKLEQFNPCASVKDRTALGMIDDAEKRGTLTPGTTIVEATSGNTGIALAFICASRGYRLIVVMPESMSLERQRMLRAFGARVELTPAHLGMTGAIERSEQIQRETPGSLAMKQFVNPANPAIHQSTTAEEILADTDGAIDVLVAGVGTGGTISGIGRRLKKHNPAIEIVAVEPATSSVLSGGKQGAHSIQGIGAGFVPETFDRSVVTEIVQVTDSEAYDWTRQIMLKEGILAGISSGAAACGAAKYLKRSGKKAALVVVMFPDTGERYLSIPMLVHD